MHTTSYCMDSYICTSIFFIKLMPFTINHSGKKAVACRSSVDIQTLQKATHKYPLDPKPGMHLPADWHVSACSWCMPGFLKLLLFRKLLCVDMCASTPKAINN